MKKINNWNSFSRGVLVALLIIASFCGICGLGAKLNTIPWLLIAGGVCLLAIFCSLIWVLGYLSKKTSSVKDSLKPTVSSEPSDCPTSTEATPVKRVAYDCEKDN